MYRMNSWSYTMYERYKTEWVNEILREDDDDDDDDIGSRVLEILHKLMCIYIYIFYVGM